MPSAVSQPLVVTVLGNCEFVFWWCNKKHNDALNETFDKCNLTAFCEGNGDSCDPQNAQKMSASPVIERTFVNCSTHHDCTVTNNKTTISCYNTPTKQHNTRPFCLSQKGFRQLLTETIISLHCRTATFRQLMGTEARRGQLLEAVQN
jgi:hypothetical protein